MYLAIHHINNIRNFGHSTGAFFDESDANALDIFKIAIGRQNAFNVEFRLEPIIKQITSMDGFQAEQAGNYWHCYCFCCLHFNILSLYLFCLCKAHNYIEKSFFNLCINFASHNFASNIMLSFHLIHFYFHWSIGGFR